jgi:hypothetical protein
MFFNWLETLEIECDAPPYGFVRACSKLGFLAPEDVRWCSKSNASQAPPKQRGGLLVEAIKAIFRWTAPRRTGCICRHQLPELAKYIFTFGCGGKKHLLLGQCHRCLTIFWREP